jgi:hypothetical protein
MRMEDKQRESDQQRDSLTSIIDSLSRSKALLLDKGLRLERDSIAEAIAIYKGLSKEKTDDFYSVEAKNRLHYWATSKFLETIRVANAGSVDKEKYFNQFPGYSIDSFLTHFSKRNFSIYDHDADGEKEVSYTIEDLRKQLTERQGPAFAVIAQMGYFYSLQYPYPETGFPVYTEYRTDSYVAEVANCRVSFIFNDDEGVYILRRIESYYLTDK